MTDQNEAKMVPALTAGSSLAAIIPTTFEEAFRLGRAVSISGMAPSSLKTPEQCTIAILHGLEVGLRPMQAIQSIAVINGRPTIWGDAAIGLVRSSPDCEWIKEESEGGDLWITDKEGRVVPNLAFTFVCTAKRRGEPEPVSRRFSVANAMTAKLWGKRGSNGQDTPWITYPDRMLQMRARSWCLRDLFADVLKGLQIREEVEDYGAPLNITPDGPAGLADRLKPVGEGFSAANGLTPPPEEPQDAQFEDAATDEPADTADTPQAPESASGVAINEEDVEAAIDAVFAGPASIIEQMRQGECPTEPDLTLAVLDEMVDLKDWALSYVRGLDQLETEAEVRESWAVTEKSETWKRVTKEDKPLGRSVIAALNARVAAIKAVA